MTSEHTNQPYESRLESMLSGITAKVDNVDTMVRHVYNAVSDIAGRTDEIFDAIEYHRDSPTYDPGMDFLDEIDE